MAEYYVGTSGWHYEHWRELFYPPGLPRAKWLDFYSRCFATVELNNSFYRLPSEKAYSNWRDSSPAGFVFSVKVNRFITHIKKLRNVEKPLENFLSRTRLLGEKLGPLLYQLPPSMKCNAETLEAFLALLPAHYSHAFEFRHASWLDDRIFGLLEQYHAGFCIFDMPGLTTPVIATTNFAYVRFHGSSGLYSSCYTDEELQTWADKMSGLSQSIDRAYVYFNNDAEAYAVRNALTLLTLLDTEKTR